MDSYQKFLQIEEDLRKTFNFGDLGFKAENLAKFIVAHPGETPVQLVYQAEDGTTESDNKIREDLSKLIGFELYNHNQTYVILTTVITKENLRDPKNATVGELREIAKKIHPDAKPIPDWLAAVMWAACRHYYCTNFLLQKRGIYLPDIQVLSSIKEDEDDSSLFIDWNSSCGLWTYLDEDGGTGRIEGRLPVWCYYIKK